MNSAFEKGLEDGIYLNQVIAQLKKDEYHFYMNPEDEVGIQAAVNFYFDHLVPFVKMLGNNYEWELSNTISTLFSDEPQVHPNTWKKTVPILEKAMELIA